MSINRLLVVSSAMTFVTIAVVQSVVNRSAIDRTRLKEIALISALFSAPIPQISGLVCRNIIATTFELKDPMRVEGLGYLLTTLGVAYAAKKIFNLSIKMSFALWFVSMFIYQWEKETRRVSRYLNQLNLYKVPPSILMGFANYGFSCWVGSAMQVLLACQRFEEIARRPLRKMMVQHYNNALKHYERETRLDTYEEFQQRLDVQRALINLFDRRKCGNQQQLTDGLKNLHLKMSCFRVTPPPCLEDPSTFFDALNEIFQYHETILYRFDPSWLFEESDNVDHIKSLRGGIGSSPQIIITRGRLQDRLDQLSVNHPIDLSSCFEKGGTYRVVGIVKQLSGHVIAYVRHNDRWYCCNDEKVVEVKLDSMDLSMMDSAVLELCESK